MVDPFRYKDEILNNYDQVSIFAAYLDTSESDIEDCLSKNYTMHNTQRNDPNPSVGFISVMDKAGNYKIKMKDFGDPYWCGDVFDIVGKILHINSNSGHGFVTICKDIINTMSKYELSNTRKVENYAKLKDLKTIQIAPRLWKQSDIDFFKKNGLELSDIKNIYHPVNKAYIINDNISKQIYYHTDDDPCYAYHVMYHNDVILYKLYFPYRKGTGKPRFITNNQYYPLERMFELKKADILVITKSFKDNLLIKKVIKSLHLKYSIEVTNFAAESSRLDEKYGRALNNIYKLIVVNCDFDKAGIACMNYHKKNYNMIPLTFTNGSYGMLDHKAKDSCEYFAITSYNDLRDLFKETYTYIENLIDNEAEI